MKIKEWIVIGLVLALATVSRAVGAETKDIIQLIEQIEQDVAALSTDGSETAGTQVSFYSAIEDFQNHVWQAMALDPGPNAQVPVNQVPKRLFAAELNAALADEFEEIKKMNQPKEVEAEFAQYAGLIQQILDFRKIRKFPEARAIAKRGTLGNAFDALIKKIPDDPHPGSPANTAHIKGAISTLKAQVSATLKDGQKKEVFGGGNRWVWYSIVALAGFLFGIVGYRMNPDFFQKLIDQSESNAPSATTPSAAAKLDYARWLREFEEILTRLKSSQLSHERRIDDLIQNAEKINHHATSLYGDARIKNEANLEFRMSTLLKEIQHQTEQGMKLQGGDRVQFNIILEHCLRLCDGIENNSIHIERSQLNEGASRHAG